LSQIEFFDIMQLFRAMQIFEAANACIRTAKKIYMARKPHEQKESCEATILRMWF